MVRADQRVRGERRQEFRLEVYGSIRANIIRSAGSSVTARIAARAIARFFEYASGLNSRPSWSTSTKTGRNATAMTSSEKKTEGPTSFSASRRTVWKSPFLPPASSGGSCCSVLDLDDRPSTSTRSRSRCGQAHDVDRHPHVVEGDERQQHRDGIVTIGTSADGTCHRKRRITKPRR